LNDRLSLSFWIMISRKLILFSVSVSIVNFIVGKRLLKELKTLYILVDTQLYAMRISSTYWKYPRMLFCVKIFMIFVCSTC
jgi:hypothetical protein